MDISYNYNKAIPKLLSSVHAGDISSFFVKKAPESSSNAIIQHAHRISLLKILSRKQS
jgi:hypothetical protein